ncbi:LytTR family DNA-binding domain-containing protein [Clostridium sediminicola]|uniref:LytR/AlgR family response regulator transcription factor n=1 Tax=Clostridium sediminicola TaxID=3114879 RepID=UPI0031F1E658
MISICICDDEKMQRKDLKSIISMQFQLKGIEFSVVEYENGEDLLSVIRKDRNSYDIIFLDIEMNKINGIETARQVRLLNDTAIIIFITGFSDYVFDGYEVKAFNYVMKPYRQEKIVDVLFKALKQVYKEQNDFFMVQSSRNAYKINYNDIIYFVSDKRRIKVITSGENIYEFYEKLDDIEKKLPQFFVRIHQRYLVNLNFVLSIENNFIEIKDEKLPISRRRYQDVMISFAKTMLM